MLPDISLCLKSTSNTCVPHTWLHFDAKYKVANVGDLFGPDIQTAEHPALRYKREDLMTMHAYKDAVRRSTGAYVLYPGTEQKTFSEFQSVVPGIGAFPLCPTAEGARGREALRNFISDVLRTVAEKAAD
jgi:predicted component of viral defense system (DUF524 family)